jgi:hypothetical protein
MKTLKPNMRPKKFKIPRVTETKDSNLKTTIPSSGLSVDYEKLNNNKKRSR